MNNIYESGIYLIQFLQGLGDWLIAPMMFFTNLGIEEFYLLVTPILFWCIDTSVGIRTAIMLMLSTSLYSYAKWIFHEPRPFWVTTKVVAHVHETSFGLPSGHAQNSVAIWGTIAYYFRKKWLWILAVVLMLCIGISRLVLGVHFPQDTLLGWALGLILLVAFIKIEDPILGWWNELKATQKAIFLFIFSLVIILIAFIILISYENWQMPINWKANIQSAFPNEELENPMALSSVVTLGGTFFGLTLGHTLLFSKNGYNPSGSLWQYILRYVIGLVGIGVFYFGLKVIFPDGEDFIPLIFRYIRYFLVGLWVTFLAPEIYIKTKIASPSNSN